MGVCHCLLRLWMWMWMGVVVVGLWSVVRRTVGLKGVEVSRLLLVVGGLMRLLLPLDLLALGRRLVVVEAVIVSRLLLLLGMWLSVLRVWWYAQPRCLLEQAGSVLRLVEPWRI